MIRRKTHPFMEEVGEPHNLGEVAEVRTSWYGIAYFGYVVKWGSLGIELTILKIVLLYW